MTTRGFTLIEVILAMLIMAMIGTLTFGAMSATFKTQATVAERSVLQEIGTAAVAKLRDDLSQAFVVESPKQLTFLRGEDNSDQDKLSFTTLSHLRPAPNSRESDQAEVSYELESDSSQMGLYRLRRAERPYLDGQNQKIDSSAYVVIADRVVSLNLEYSNGQTFAPVWNTQAEGQRNRLPRAVKVTLKLRDEKGREEDFDAYVEVPMSEAIAQAVQPTPAGGPTPVPGTTPTPTRRRPPPRGPGKTD
jgi:type II secretion system protein J